MATIPIAEIPRGPESGNAAVPLPLGAIRIPRVEEMGIVEDASYLMVGRAYEKLGEAGMRAANVLADWAQTSRKAQDTINMAELDAAVTTAKADFEVEVSKGNVAPDQYNKIWQEKYKPRLEQTLGKFTFSQEGAARAGAWWREQSAQIGAGIHLEANKTWIERGRMALDTKAERQALAGDHEGSFATINEGVAAGLYSPEEGEAKKVKYEGQAKTEARQTMWADIEMMARAEGPISAKKYREDAEAAAKPDAPASKLMPGLESQEDKNKAVEMLRQIEEEESMVVYQRAIDRVRNNEFADADAVRKEFQGLLPRKLADNLLQEFVDTPKEQGRRLELRPGIMATIKAYNIAADPNGEVFTGIQKAIRQLPKGFQKDLSDMLFETWRTQRRDGKPAPSTAVEVIVNDAQDMLDSGQYGSWDVNNEGYPADENAWKEKFDAVARMSRDVDAYERWAKTNKDDAADQSKALAAWWNIRVEHYKADKAAGRAIYWTPNQAQLDAARTMSVPDPSKVLDTLDALELQNLPSGDPDAEDEE